MNEYLELEHHIYSYQIKESLKIVYEYIKKNKLILVGGQAMDISLKMKNSGIYDKYSIPDYDAISPDFFIHAKNIGNILCKKNFPNVNVIPAVHNTTIRVKVSNYTIFDSTYCPEKIFKNIKTLKYLGLDIIHPDYQKIDQYNSLSFLFDNTGISYNIFHRLEKDIERNKLLCEIYPIESNILPKDLIKVSIPINLIKSHNFKKINLENYIESYDDICCHGFLAYSIYYTKTIELLQKYKYFLTNEQKNKIDKLLEKIIQSEFKIEKNNCYVEIPKNEKITFINGTNKINATIKLIDKYFKIKDTIYYNKLLEVLPIKIELLSDIDFELYDTTGKLLSCNLFEFNEISLIVSNYNYILSYFLSNYYYNNKDSYYLTYYLSLLNIIEILKIISLIPDISNSIEIGNYSLSTYGIYNYNDSYYYFIYNFNYLLENKKNSNEKPPKIYTEYPECNTDKEFNENNSMFFNIDGEKNKNMKYTNYLYLLD